MKPEIKNIRKASARIIKAVKNREKIILYGDPDPDGVVSVVILKEVLDFLGCPPPRVYFPDREDEGYGLTKSALKFLKKESPALLLIVDCGITNVEEISIAQKKGFDVVLIDHHQPLKELPPASIIVAPKQKGDRYPFKQLANAGLVYKLVKLLLQEIGQNYPLERFLELVIIATLSDLMPLVDDNEKLVDEGLMALRYTERVGLKALMRVQRIEDVTMDEVRSKIIPPLNAAKLRDHINEAYFLFTESSSEKAEQLVRQLIRTRQENRQKTDSILREIGVLIPSFPSPIIFLGKRSWPRLLLGRVASILCHENKKPVFLFSKKKEESGGVVRTPANVDGVKAMMYCDKLLGTYGGHPQASGFAVKNKNLEQLEKCLINYFLEEEK